VTIASAPRVRIDLGSVAEQFDVPGAVLAVQATGQVFEIAAGVLDRATGAPVTTDAVFEIGSITKVWTAALVMSLVESGRLSLDDLVLRHLPELRLQDDAAARALTVRHLLNHTSGLPGDWFPDTGDDDDCLGRLVGLLASVPLTHPVGALTSYSNAALSVAGRVVERVLGRTWDQAMRERVIAPLKLRRSFTSDCETPGPGAVGHAGPDAGDGLARLPRACGPAGLVRATAADVLRFGREFLDGDGTGLLNAESVRAMTTSSSWLPAPTSTASAFGLGWGISEWEGQPVLAHDGGTIGQAAALRVIPGEGVVIALVTNGGDWLGFRDAVLDTVMAGLSGPRPPSSPRPPRQPVALNAADYVGRYERLGVELLVEALDAGLLLRCRNTDAVERQTSGSGSERRLIATGPDAVLVQEHSRRQVWSAVRFLRSSSGPVDYLHCGGRAAERVRSLAADTSA
jgi:CubicO group peptidase (beta-lactamase class C family)